MIGAVVAGVTVVYNSENNSLSITPSTGYIKIFTDNEIPVINKSLVANGIQWTGYAYSGGEPGSISENIQNFIPSPGAIAYNCYFLNLQNITNIYIYITSPNLGSFDTISSFSVKI